MVTVQIPGLVLDRAWLPRFIPTEDVRRSIVKILKSQSGVLFPDYYFGEFYSLLGPEDEPVFADLALVSKNMRSWCLLFVEPWKTADMDSLQYRIESAERHLYGVDEAQELTRNITGLKWDDVRDLVPKENPYLVVVTDYPLHGWKDCLSEHRAQIMVVEPFGDGERQILRIDGEYPIVEDYVRVGICNRDRYVHDLLRVESESLAWLPAESEIAITYGGQLSTWVIMRSDTGVFLKPSGDIYLVGEGPFELFRQANGVLWIKSVGGDQ